MKLNTFAKNVLGDQKVDIHNVVDSPESIPSILKNGDDDTKCEIAKYCEQDVRLVYRLYKFYGVNMSQKLQMVSNQICETARFFHENEYDNNRGYDEYDEHGNKIVEEHPGLFNNALRDLVEPKSNTDDKKPPTPGFTVRKTEAAPFSKPINNEYTDTGRILGAN